MRLTRDHTVVQQEIDAGRLTPELARLLPAQAHPHPVGRVPRPGRARHDHPGGRAGRLFLLCSDGMTDPLDDDAIQRIVATTPLDMLAHVLVEEALKAGSEDNVTVVAVGATP